ncbi:unnamed protein product, partial [Brassica rapa]
ITELVLFVPSVGSACVWGWIVVPTAYYESDQQLENKDCKFVGWTKRPTVYNKVSVNKDYDCVGWIVRSTMNKNVFRQRLQIYVGWIKRSTINKMSLDKKKKWSLRQ